MKSNKYTAPKCPLWFQYLLDHIEFTRPLKIILGVPFPDILCLCFPLLFTISISSWQVIAHF